MYIDDGSGTHICGLKELQLNLDVEKSGGFRLHGTKVVKEA